MLALNFFISRTASLGETFLCLVLLDTRAEVGGGSCGGTWCHVPSITLLLTTLLKTLGELCLQQHTTHRLPFLLQLTRPGSHCTCQTSSPRWHSLAVPMNSDTKGRTARSDGVAYPSPLLLTHLPASHSVLLSSCFTVSTRRCVTICTGQ